MAHQDMFLWKGPNKDGPSEEEFTRILAKYPTAWSMGMSLPSETNSKISELSVDFQQPPKLKSLLATCKQFKDVGLMFHFMNYPEGFNKDDRQPFSVLKQNNAYIALAYIHGQIPAFIKDGKRSAAANLAEGELMPLLAELWNDSKGDLAKFKKLFDGATVQRSIRNCMVKGHVAFMLQDGDIISIDKEAVPIKTEYGWTTDECKSVTKTKPAKAEEKAVEAAPPARKRGIVEDEPEAAPEIVEEEPDEKPDLPAAAAAEASEIIEEEDDETEVSQETLRLAKQLQESGSVTAIQAAMARLPLGCEFRNGHEVWYVPPQGLDGNALKRGGYGRTAGFLPDGKRQDEFGNVYGHWKYQKPAVRVQSEKLKAFGLLKVVEIAAAAKIQVPVTGEQIIPEKLIEANADSYIIDPKTIDKINEQLQTPRVLRVLDEYSKQIPSPNALQAAEKKLPDFGTSIGVPLMDTAKWTIPLMLEVVPTRHALAVLAASWKLEAMKRMSKEELAALGPKAPGKKEQPHPEQRKGIAAA